MDFWSYCCTYEQLNNTDPWESYFKKNVTGQDRVKIDWDGTEKILLKIWLYDKWTIVSF